MAAKKKSPRIASGRKRARQNVKINARNSALRSRYRNVVKNLRKLILAKNFQEAREIFPSVQKTMDSIGNKGIFHKNKVARQKSRLNSQIKALYLASTQTA